jgi:hypothetical protein
LSKGDHIALNKEWVVFEDKSISKLMIDALDTNFLEVTLKSYTGEEIWIQFDVY